MSAKIRKIIGVILFAGAFSNLYSQQYMDYLQLAKIELQNNNYTKCIEDLNIYVKEQPHMYEGYFFRAFAKYQLDDLMGAEADYTKAIALYPFRADIFCYRAIARDRLSDFTGALDDYKAAIALDSTDAEIYVNRANTYLELNRFKAALADCNHAEQLNIKDENVYNLRAAAESGLKLYNEAIRDYTTAIQKNPKNLPSYIQRGVTYKESSHNDSALLDYNYVLSVDSNNGYALYERAMMEVEDSDLTDGLRDLNRVIALSPGCAVAYFNRAILFSNTGHYLQALNDYNAVTQIDPTGVLAYFNRAGLEQDNGDKKAALEDYNKAIELAPDFARAYYYRSLLKKDMNNLKGSDADLARANEIEGEKALLPDSIRNLEEIRLTKMNALPGDFTTSGDDEKGRVQDKQADIELRPIYRVVLWVDTSRRIKVYELPKRPANANTLLLTNNNGIDEAEARARIARLDSAITINNQVADYYLSRAILYGWLQLYDKALADYDKSIALDPHNEVAYFSRANDRYNYLESQPDSPSKKNSAGSSGRITYDMVNKDYTRAIQMDSNFSYAWYNRANLKANSNDFTGALKDLAKVFASDSTLAEAYYNTGLLLFLLKDDLQACEYTSKAGELGILEAYMVIKRYCYKKR